MTNIDTQYWKRVLAYLDRVESGEERPDYTELLSRAKKIAQHGRDLNVRVAKLEAENARLRAALTEIHLTRRDKGEINRD